MLLGDMDEGVGIVILMNGPGNPRRLAEYAIDALVATRRGGAPPPVPVEAALDSVADATAYAGSYSDSTGWSLEVEAEAGRLTLVTPTGRSILYRDGEDSFLSLDTAFARFPLHFGRKDGCVVELIHGGHWFAGTAYQGPVSIHQPPAWRAYIGHYRAQVPYYSNYRVIARRGELLLVSPEGVEEVLVPLGGARFSVGKEPQAVEQVQFLDVVSGRALRLTLAGTDYYRSTAP
jgi:D-alanyl-D-alanine carboxypeptidase